MYLRFVGKKSKLVVFNLRLTEMGFFYSRVRLGKKSLFLMYFFFRSLSPIFYSVRAQFDLIRRVQMLLSLVE